MRFVRTTVGKKQVKFTLGLLCDRVAMSSLDGLILFIDKLIDLPKLKDPTMNPHSIEVIDQLTEWNYFYKEILLLHGKWTINDQLISNDYQQSNEILLLDVLKLCEKKFCLRSVDIWPIWCACSSFPVETISSSIRISPVSNANNSFASRRVRQNESSLWQHNRTIVRLHSRRNIFRSLSQQRSHSYRCDSFLQLANESMREQHQRCAQNIILARPRKASSRHSWTSSSVRLLSSSVLARHRFD